MKISSNVVFLGILAIASTGLTADKTGEPKPTIRDIELGDGGLLAGKILSQTGRPLAHQKISVKTNRQEMEAISDETGAFVIPGMQGGACVVVVKKVTYGCRLWVKGTAPPRALTAIVVVDQSEVVRGQDDDGVGIALFEPHHALAKISHENLLHMGLSAGIIGAVSVAIINSGDASD